MGCRDGEDSGKAVGPGWGTDERTATVMPTVSETILAVLLGEARWETIAEPITSHDDRLEPQAPTLLA